MDREDAACVRRTLAGDRAAFEPLVRRHHPDLLRALRRITRNLQDAEDAAQEAFLKAFRALDRFDQSRAFRPWVWTIGIRTALQAMARHERRAASLDASAADAGAPPVPQAWLEDARSLERVEGDLLRRDLADALGCLDDAQRAIVVLVVLEEHTYDETAQILEIPIGTVMSRLHRARLRLKERLSGGPRPGDPHAPGV